MREEDRSFRIGQTSHYVKPGDLVWTDVEKIARVSGFTGRDVPISKAPVRGLVTFEGTVFVVAINKIVPLDQCRLARDVIRLD